MYLFGVETLIIDHLGKDRVGFTETWTITIAPGVLLPSPIRSDGHGARSPQRKHSLIPREKNLLCYHPR